MQSAPNPSALRVVPVLFPWLGDRRYINVREAKRRGDTTADISRMFIYYVGRKKDQMTFHEDGSP